MKGEVRNSETEACEEKEVSAGRWRISMIAADTARASDDEARRIEAVGGVVYRMIGHSGPRTE